MTHTNFKETTRAKTLHPVIITMQRLVRLSAACMREINKPKYAHVRTINLCCQLVFEDWQKY